jgi:hypothetical protein
MTSIARRIALILIMLSSAPSFAQQSQTPSSPENAGSSSGTAPENRGSTGWTGHQGETYTTGSGTPADQNSAAAADQPLTATGKDLEGPPTRFPANKTPE